MRPGAYGYQDALAASRADLTGIPLAVATGPVTVPFGGTELVVTWATLTPGGVKLRLRAAIPDHGQPLRRPVREVAERRVLADDRAVLAVRATDDTGAEHQGMAGSGGGSPRAAASSGSGRRCRRRRGGSG